MFAIDTETHPIACGRQLPSVVCMSVASPALKAPLLLIGDQIPAAFADMLLSGEPIYAHNASFDMGAIAVSWPALEPFIALAYKRDQIRCTLLREQLADFAIGVNRHRYNLADCCERAGLPGKADDTTWRLRFGELDGLPLSDWPQAARDYAIQDAVACMALALRGDDPIDLGPQSRYAFWLQLSSALGVTPDPIAVADWAKQLYIKEAVLRRRAESAGLIRADGSRNMAAIRARIQATGKARKTPGGAVAVDALSCRKCGDPVMADYALYASVLAAIDRELPIFQAPYVHTNYGMAETGRTTSAKPNLQNLTTDSGSRLCLKPRDGMVFLDSDYNRLELCCIAQLCIALKCGSALADAIRAGVNPHKALCARLTGKQIEALDTAHADAKPYRLSKETNFGLPGGMGDTAFIAVAEKRGIELTRAQAASVRRAWRTQWPEIPAYQQIVSGYAEQNGFIEHYKSGRIRGGIGYTQACNSPFQGLGADITKDCGWRLYRAGLLPSLFVHDEYLNEVPIKSYRDAASTIARITRETAADWLPDVPTGADPCAAMRWIKDDPRYDDAGRLIIIG